MKIYKIDAFTDISFTGNPAAVCFLESQRENAWMQNIAMEMNLSETAFVWPKEQGFELKWFTPTSEVDLCGHATLATAHAIWEEGIKSKDSQIEFYTKSGTLTTVFSDEWIEMDFPSLPAKQISPPEGLIEALHAKASYVGENKYDYLVEVTSEIVLRKLRPDFLKLARFDIRGVIVTARSTEYDFVSRFFAPGVGISEDPVTGSAHCCLAPYWGSKIKKDTMVGYQASQRGGVVRVQVKGDRVLLGGKAVTILKGNLLV
jgi:PhzF family phenazine biosynthesis protein